MLIHLLRRGSAWVDRDSARCAILFNIFELDDLSNAVSGRHVILLVGAWGVHRIPRRVDDHIFTKPAGSGVKVNNTWSYGRVVTRGAVLYLPCL